MSTFDDDSDSSDGGGRPEADLRAARKERDKAMALLEQLSRREAARDAGLDLSNPQHRFFVEHFDGTPDDMASKAREMGYLSSAEQQQQAEADASTAALGRVSQAASAGGNPSTSTQSGQRDAALRDEAQALMAGIKSRQVDASQVDEWARKAGVPFIGED